MLLIKWRPAYCMQQFSRGFINDTDICYSFFKRPIMSHLLEMQINWGHRVRFEQHVQRQRACVKIPRFSKMDYRNSTWPQWFSIENYFKIFIVDE